MKRAKISTQKIVQGNRVKYKLSRPHLDEHLRTAIHDRSRGRCDMCGQPVNPDRWECHHRLLRSQGGEDSHANLICLHTHCHGQVHHRPAWSYRNGLLVPSWARPEEWPVLRHGIKWQQPAEREWVGARPNANQEESA
jgi:hypothetical protein